MVGKRKEPEAVHTVSVPETTTPRNQKVGECATKCGRDFLARASKYVRNADLYLSKVVRGVDIAFKKADGEEARAGEAVDRVDVQFHRTKEDPPPSGCTPNHYKLPAGEEPMGVASALEDMRRPFQEKVDGVEKELPLFRRKNNLLVRKEHIQKLVEAAAEAANLQKNRFRWHSLRIGGASALLHTKRQFDLVKRFGRRTPDSAHTYLQDSALQYKDLAHARAQDQAAAHYKTCDDPLEPRCQVCSRRRADAGCRYCGFKICFHCISRGRWCRCGPTGDSSPFPTSDGLQASRLEVGESVEMIAVQVNAPSSKTASGTSGSEPVEDQTRS